MAAQMRALAVLKATGDLPRVLDAAACTVDPVGLLRLPTPFFSRVRARDADDDPMDADLDSYDARGGQNRPSCALQGRIIAMGRAQEGVATPLCQTRGVW